MQTRNGRAAILVVFVAYQRPQRQGKRLVHGCARHSLPQTWHGCCSRGTQETQGQQVSRVTITGGRVFPRYRGEVGKRLRWGELWRWERGIIDGKGPQGKKEARATGLGSRCQTSRMWTQKSAPARRPGRQGGGSMFARQVDHVVGEIQRDVIKREAGIVELLRKNNVALPSPHVSVAVLSGWTTNFQTWNASAATRAS